ncbi:hypothetical protein Zmor_007480 [Zophobas morio]|mgnify:FL=1|uniref:Uncharacterized protein n=1 Tax=Zophobas morio TaxID=2755281 RepID=A0AA38MPD3_9CUCU|nr:hypothetical protein Zmor_007480 [Zophobas morio]
MHSETTSSDNSKTCFICAIRPILQISWLNTFSAKYFCAHSRPSSYPHFEKSDFLCFMSLLSAGFLVISAAITLFEIKSMKFPELILSIMMFQACVVTFTIIFTLQKYMDLQICHHHGILYIVENRHYFEIDEFFGKTFKNDVLKIVWQFCTPYLVLTIVVFGASLYNYQNLTNELVRKLVTLLINIITNLSNFIVTLLFADVYSLLFKRCHKQIETVLRQRCYKSPNTNSFQMKFSPKTETSSFAVATHENFC